MAGSSPVLLYAFYAAFILVLALVAQAESGASAVTAPAEVRALNLKWSISATPNQWNTSGKPCSGAAIHSTSLDVGHYNPFIKDYCSYENKATCHITQLNLAQNYLTGSLSSSIRNMTCMQNLNFGISTLSGELPNELGELSELRSFKASPLLLWASETYLTSRIPDSKRNLSKLTVLRLQGNSSESPISLTFSNMASLTGSSLTMMVSELSIGSGLLPAEVGNPFDITLPSRWNSTLKICQQLRRFNVDFAYFQTAAYNKPPSSKRKRTFLIFRYVSGVGALFLLCASVLSCLFKRRKQKPADDIEEILDIHKLRRFSYTELRTATEDFAPANKLGEGGFGPVYKGKFKDGRLIAVKKLAAGSHQGSKEFISEITTISSVQHRNLVKLYGYCNEGDKQLLVFEFLENRSLDQALFGDTSLNLSWSKRKEICLAVAKGLAYLHEDSGLQIIHRDVKASNILLDRDYIPKISDFGLAKLCDDTKTHVNTNPAGTCGYWAPEYALYGCLSKKVDVYSFGVVVQEIVSGRKSCDLTLEEDKRYLPTWALRLYQNNSEVDLVDSRLEEFNNEEVKRVIEVSLLCTQENPNARPSMSEVVKMLSDILVGAVASRPFHSTDSNYDDATSRRGLVTVERVVLEPPPSPSLEQPATAEDMEIDQHDQNERIVLEPPPGPSREQPANAGDMDGHRRYDQSETEPPHSPFCADETENSYNW